MEKMIRVVICVFALLAPSLFALALVQEEGETEVLRIFASGADAGVIELHFGHCR